MSIILPTNSLTSITLGSIALAGAEISAYDSVSQRVFTTSNAGLQIIDLSDPANPVLVDTIAFPGGSDVTSVATWNGLIAVAVPAATRTDPGTVFLIDADGNILDQFSVGALPDMLTFSPDGTRILVANEGEATLLEDVEAGATYVNPEGSISVITLETGTVQTAGFTSFNDDSAQLIADGVRLFASTPGFNAPTVAQDLEPEYIALSSDGLTAWVTLQEANAVAVVDLRGAEPVVSEILPLGLKSWEGLEFDSRDQNSGPLFKTDLPIFGMYMPDGISSYEVAGQTYYVTANEGDDRNDFVEDSASTAETIRFRDLSVELDPVIYPNPTALRANGEIGRLNVSQLPGLNGDTDGDGDIDQILTYGARSFSIWDSAGNLVFDSGAEIDTFVAANFPELYDDSRSDNKGSEPESVTVAVFEGRTYAFIGLERYNSTIVYDITDPAEPLLATFLANAGDVGPEGGLFIAAGDSPSGAALFLASNEVSNTLTVYELTVPATEGGNGADRLVGTISADELAGGNGDDLIYANAGDDQLYGGNGDDELDGGRGDDLLSGGRGNDLLTTGIGEDLIHVGRGNGADVVTDFDTALDRIVLQDRVQLLGTSLVDHDGDGQLDLQLQFAKGGGTMVLLGVSDATAVDYLVG